ncbi:hypothetical protein Bca52824_065811 [Brassica carinata]|uniref:RNase H type-1 domain-containing protein n=1 Tax=Brassica carinata TaxID=52824 RepID=A0A8X7QJ78_BRACI|nr:hypothetical protein Bca52824_065811 [Brassica carinata]
MAALEEATIWTGVNKSNGPSLIHPSSIESMSTLAGFPSQAGLTAELRCIIWSLRSLGDLGFKDVVIGVDNQEAIKEISNASAWPRYRSFLDTIAGLRNSFEAVHFEQESMKTNFIARDISRSVLRDGRYQTYLALGGPAWLHNRIRNEALTIEC